MSLMASLLTHKIIDYQDAAGSTMYDEGAPPFDPLPFEEDTSTQSTSLTIHQSTNRFLLLHSFKDPPTRDSDDEEHGPSAESRSKDGGVDDMAGDQDGAGRVQKRKNASERVESRGDEEQEMRGKRARRVNTCQEMPMWMTEVRAYLLKNLDHPRMERLLGEMVGLGAKIRLFSFSDS